MQKQKLSLKRITIDTNPDDCNFNCIMCEQHSNFKQKQFDYKESKRRIMPKKWLRSIFEEAKQFEVTEIIPSTMGEPLLYKYFDTIIELSKIYNIKLNLTTNGSFPKKTVTEWAKLIVPTTSDIKISLNGATKITSEKIMKGNKYEKQLQNIKELIKFRNQHFAKTGYYCSITFQLTFMQNNMHELSDIVKLASKLGVDRIKGHHLWTHFEEIKNLSFKYSKEGVKNWNKIVEKAIRAQAKYRKQSGDKIIFKNIYPIEFEEKQKIPEHYKCPFLNKELWISATGKISPCCAPDELRNSLGDFGTYPNTNFKTVIESKTYKNLYHNYKEITLCKTCNMRQPK